MRIFLILCWICTALLAFAAPTPEESFAQAELKLQQGQFEEALVLYQAAYEGNQDNAEYRRAYNIIQNVIQFRKVLPAEKDMRRWTSMALSLRAFYMEHRIYSEAYQINQQIYAQHNNPIALTWLVETQILTQRYEEASELLAKNANLNNNLMALQGIAYFKTGQLEKAKTVAQQLAMISATTPGFCYYAGMLEALLSNYEMAIAHLVHGCQATPPSRLETYKAMINQAPEFQELQKLPAFAEVTNAKSLMKESDCSGGSNCGSCPNRNSCGKQ